MSNIQNTEMQNFIAAKIQDYQNKVTKIKLFQTEFNQSLTLEQKQLFIKVFYHMRGHFYKFLWNLGNFTPNKEYKKVVLDNINEELGISGSKSHERMFMEFAKHFGVDIIDEIINETSYVEFTKDFHNGHIKFILENDFEMAWSAFAAYELEDNVDYAILENLAKNIGTPKEKLTFFTVHKNAGHFSSTETLLLEIWNKNPEKVKQSFNFIFEHQLQSWQNLSDLVLET
jgi:pyrroloquinoline quinone (PQQ) biosynthesis protein C